MLSMTGYGRGEYKENGVELTVEIKTVNNRYLDAAIKCPKIFAAYEETIRAKVREKLTRGHADVYISLQDRRDKPKNLTVDLSAARAYVDAAGLILREFSVLQNDLTVTSVMKMPDVLKQDEASAADDELTAGLDCALADALEKLNAMRFTEGEKLKRDLLARMDVIERLVGEIGERAPLVSANYAEKLKEKMEKYLDGVQYDETRLLTEVALFADKSNIDEELTRLRSHISQFRTISESPLVGRKLDFLVQEFNRETNTICSKSNDIAITKCGLDLKNEIEKVREQVQNLE